jgi:hypothetical protein
MEKWIDAKKDLLPDDKNDLKENVARVADEVSKGRQAPEDQMPAHLKTPRHIKDNHRCNCTSFINCLDFPNITILHVLIAYVKINP